MKEPISQNTTAHTISGMVRCCRNASGWWVYYPAVRDGVAVRLRKRLGTQELAHKFASEKAREIEENGISLGSLPREVRVAYGQYQQLLAQLVAKGKDLPSFDVLVSQALDTVRKNLLPGASSVADCVDRYLAARKPDLSAKAYLSIRNRLRHFARDFGTHSIQSITPQMITDWLEGLTRKCSGPEYGQKAGQTKASADSRNHYRAALITFFGDAFEQGWAPANPAACVKRATPDRPKATVLTPSQAENLLMTACLADPDVLPALALQMFAGLRVIEVPAIDLDELRCPNSEVINVDSPRTGRRVVPICDALRAWLEFSPVKNAYAWSGSARDLRRRLTHLFRAAGCEVGIESPRYSYCRYQLEFSQDVAWIEPVACALVAPIDVQPGAAQAYFSLTPKIATGECPAGHTCPTDKKE